MFNTLIFFIFLNLRRAIILYKKKHELLFSKFSEYVIIVYFSLNSGNANFANFVTTNWHRKQNC